jgi:putative DNA primase/helicase
MTPAQRLLERLEGVRGTGPKWTARCPGHDDRRPSLSIRERSNGDLLVHCHRGCPTEEVVEAVGLTMADLFAEPCSNGLGEEEAVYYYVHADGRPAFEVVRFGGKEFRQRTPDGRWGLNGTDPVLFRLPQVVRAVRDGVRVWVVEGEKDLEAIEKHGKIATTNPMGAGKWRKDYSETLRRADVVIVADRDEPGREHAREVAESLEGVAASVRVLEPPEHKDVSDHLAHGGKLEELVGLEFEARSALVRFSEISAKPVRWAWHERIALTKLTALAGRPKIGKGLLYTQLIARVTTGSLEGDLERPRDAIIVTTEDDPGDTLKPRLMAAGADLSRVSIFQMGARDDPVPFRVPQDAAELGRRVAETNAALTVIDPLLEFVDGKVDSHKSQPVRQAVAALNQIARETGCAVLVIFHLNKGASTDPLLRHEASAAFTQIVRGGLMLGHDPDDPDGEDGNQRVLAVSSSNLAAIAPSLVYRIDTARVIGDTGEEIVTAKIDCIGESAAGAHDLLRGQPDEEEQTGTDEAEEFLAAELADGPQPAGELTKRARGLGITEKQLRRARGRLGVSSERTGGLGASGRWQWSLATDPKAPSLRRPPNHREEGHLRRLSDQERDCDPRAMPKTPKAPLSHERASSGASSWCSCRRPARSPRAVGPDFCQTCKRSIAGTE